MISPWIIYWFTRLDALNDLFFGATMLGAIVTILILFGTFMVYLECSSEDEAKVIKTGVKYALVLGLPIFIIGIIGGTFISDY